MATTIVSPIERAIEKEFQIFLDTHRNHIREAFKRQDFDEVPDLPEYWKFVDVLYARCDALSHQFKVPTDEVNRAIDFYNAEFFRNPQY
jgi:uncharacterized protein Usg